VSEIENITPQILLNAYANGIFPMSDGRDDPDIFWVDPEWRGIIPLDAVKLSKRLRRTIKQDKFDVRIDTAFQKVVEECAKTSRNRENTWISEAIEKLYVELHTLGFAHSVECWQNDKLVGGLYGVSLRGAFFGESMFTRETDASKVALMHLIARLKVGGFHLLDTQFMTEHLSQFGALEISRESYHQHLEDAMQVGGDFYSLAVDADGETVLQPITQTS